MSEFYLESEQLNLKHVYQNISYKSLLDNKDHLVFKTTTDQQQINQNPGKFDSQPAVESLTQTKVEKKQDYTSFVEERILIKHDVLNLCQYFHQIAVDKIPFEKHAQNNGQEFPFEKIRNRICYIIQNYQEQSVLLDSMMEEVVQPVLAVIKDILKGELENKYQLSIQSSIISTQQQGNANSTVFTQNFHDLLGIVYQFCKVRGYKYVIKFFPHEVADLEPVIFYLVSQRNQQIAFWESKYVILLWLSIIILVPFDLITIDSKAFRFQESANENGIETSGQQDDIFQIILDLSKYYLNTSSKCKEAAAVVLSQFFSRPDIKKLNLLNDYMKWSFNSIQKFKDSPSCQFFVVGVFNSLVEIFKVGNRQELLDKIPEVMPFIQSTKSGKEQYESTLLRQSKIKLTQRLGMIYLKPRVVGWAYRRGKQNFQLQKHQKDTLGQGTNSKLKVFNVSPNETNLTKQFAQQLQQKQSEKHNLHLHHGVNIHHAQPEQHAHANNNNLNEEQEDDSEIYFQDVDEGNLEAIIDTLLSNLGDKDTVVRWSAAKGVGRITSRLNLEMADDIVTTVLECFLPNQSENSWHGGCLAIAELSRRGLLLPSRLKEVFSVLNKALVFDENRGTYSVGSNVRDAACFVAWAFCRAYEPEILRPYVLELANSLLITTLYDREVNCRRAAAAAFQEHVGRQGTFPFGIEILTEADYFTIGIRINAYMNVSLYVSSFETYYSGFLQHLAFTKLKHWDLEIRRLASACLSLMCPIYPQKLIGLQVIEGLAQQAFNPMVNVRHGSIYGLADILLGLGGKSEFHNMYDEAKDSVFLRSMSKNEKKLIKAGEYRSKFLQEYKQKQSINHLHLIEKSVLNNVLDMVEQFEVQNMFRGKGGEVMRVAACRLIECIALVQIELTQKQLFVYMASVEECMKAAQEEIQIAGHKAMKVLSRVYHSTLQPQYIEWTEKLIRHAHSGLHAKGYSFALSALSRVLIAHHFEAVLMVYFANCEVKESDKDDADTRKHSVMGLFEIIQTLGVDHPIIWQTKIKYAPQQQKQALLLQTENTKQKEDQTVQTMQMNVFECIFEVCIQALRDYTLDRRGDIGSIVRENAMNTMVNILKLIAVFNHSHHNNNSNIKAITNFISHGLFVKVVSSLIQQLLEKIDRTRLTAGNALQELFDDVLPFLNEYQQSLPHYQKLNGIFCQASILNKIQSYSDLLISQNQESVSQQALSSYITESEERVYYWNLPHCVYPLVVPVVLMCREYAFSAFKGLCVSVGGITESVVKHSWDALQHLVKETSTKEKETRDQLMEIIFESIKWVFKDEQNQERVIAPLLKTLEFLYEQQPFYLWDNTFFYTKQIFELIKAEIHDSKSMPKLLSVPGVLSGMLNVMTAANYDEDRKHIMNTIKELLGHKYPKIRKQMCDKLYMLFLANGEELYGTDKSEQITDFLMEIDWLMVPLKQMKDIRIQIQNLF